MVLRNEPTAVTAATRADHRATLTGVGVGFDIRLLADAIVIVEDAAGKTEVNHDHSGLAIA